MSILVVCKEHLLGVCKEHNEIMAAPPELQLALNFFASTWTTTLYEYPEYVQCAHPENDVRELPYKRPPTRVRDLHV